MSARRRFSLALVPAMVLGLGGCGGSSSTPTAPATPAPVKQVVLQGSTAGIEVGVPYLLVFSTTSTGTIDVVLDWTFATNDVDVFLAQGNDPCSTTQCTFLAFSQSTTAKPERITATSVPAGTLTLYVFNNGPGKEAVSYQIVLTH